MVLGGSWELVDGLVGIHREEGGSWAESSALLKVEDLEGNAVVDRLVGKVAHSLGD